MNTIQNLITADPFNDSSADTRKIKDSVHLRVQQRTGRKYITTIQGLSADIDLKEFVKILRKKFNCSGTIIKDEELGQIIQMSGDQRKNVYDYLIGQKIYSKEEIKSHGF